MGEGNADATVKDRGRLGGEGVLDLKISGYVEVAARVSGEDGTEIKQTADLGNPPLNLYQFDAAGCTLSSPAEIEP